MTTLAELVVPKTADEVMAELLDGLAGADFPTTAWQPGSVPRTQVETHAEVLADLSTMQALIAKGGFLDEATGDWLTLLAAQRYGVTRSAAVATKGTLRLTAASGAGPYTITAGQLVATTSSGLKFRNITGGTLTLSGTLDLTWQAETPGAAYNVAQSTITTLLTSLAGVTVSNSASDWRTTSGTDEEGDASLAQRCRDRLPALGTGATAAVYRGWAREASDEVTRVFVEADGGTGDVSVTIAGASGAVAGGVVDDVQDFLDERKPICDQPTVASAQDLEIPIVGTLFVKAAYAAGALAAAQVALDAFARTLDIGGDALGDSLQGVSLGQIIEQLMSVDGAVRFSTAMDDVVELDSDEVAIFTYDDLDIESV